jgi:hypothetical protein
MDFSLTTLFVLPVSNTLPTTGTTANLVANQFGVFKPDYTPATAGNVASQPYIILAQGRPVALPGVGTEKSDKIYLKNVIEWFKVTAHATVSQQITDISDFTASCSEDVTISVRIRSFYADTGYFNGLTKSWTLTTPCCDCGSDPCTDIDGADIQALVQNFVDLINAETTTNFDSTASFILAERIGTGSTTKLRLIARTLSPEPVTVDPTNFPFQYDRVYFWAWAYKGPVSSQDYNVWDACDSFATVTKIQDTTYPRGSSAEVAQLERDYNSYNTAPIAKQLFSDINFNQAFSSQVVAGTYYDFYYLKFKSPMNNQWNATVEQDEAVIIVNPTTINTGTIAVLTAFLGTPVDESGSLATTTTSTSSTTTSTTTV